jgi:hypothetical protein
MGYGITMQQFRFDEALADLTIVATQLHLDNRFERECVLRELNSCSGQL